MCKQALDMYDIEFMPQDMKVYLRNHGFSFSKKACEYATSLMKKENPTTKKAEKIEVWNKEQVEAFLKKYNITLENNVGYNHVYVVGKETVDTSEKIILRLFVKR